MKVLGLGIVLALDTHSDINHDPDSPGGFHAFGSSTFRFSAAAG
jgi:hypothetical protein